MLKGWKTVIFNAVIAAAGVVVMADPATLVPGQYVGMAGIVIGIIGAGLRAVTDSPMMPRRR